MLPGPVHIGDSGWVGVPPSAVTAEDVRLWPYSVDRYTSHVIVLMHFARLIVCILTARLKTSQGSECLSARFIPSTCHP